MIRIWFVDYASDRSGPIGDDRKMVIPPNWGIGQIVHYAQQAGYFTIPHDDGTQEFIPWHAVYDIIEEK